jgi:uncharacterized membrane protein SpoIIM required for sporulation
MKQLAFEERYRGRWNKFENAISRLDSGVDFGSQIRRESSPATSQPGALDPGEERGGSGGSFPEQYRAICRDLSLATQRDYSPDLQKRLNTMALEGHRILYARDTNFAARFKSFITRDFPAELRREYKPMLAATALFLLPALAVFSAIQWNPEFIYSVMGPEQVAGVELMYDPALRRIGTDRTGGSDIQMFGFYIMNNIGIGFRTFATGIAWGIGSAFFLVLNGLLIGAVSAHIIQLGFQDTFFSFVVGHGAFELTAIIIAGAAGLKIGDALIAPGRRSRVTALRRAAQQSIGLIYGVIAMLVIAAIIEAFWSSKGSIPTEIKYAFGALCWLAVVLYFSLVGRRRAT